MMKRLVAIVLSMIIFLMLSACAAQNPHPQETATVSSQSESEPVTVNHPQESKEQQAINAEAAAAVRRYVEARIKTDAFVAADFHAMSADATAQMINELAQQWESALNQATVLQSSASAMKASAPKGMAVTLLRASVGNRFSVRTLSADSGAASAPASTLDPKSWAENFTKQYDSIKGANTIKQLAAQLGTDAKEAYAQLTLAQDIIRSGAAEDAAYYDKLTKIAQATKTACKVGLFVTATIATGGGTLGTLGASSMTLGQAGAVIVGGTDCIVDVATTGSTIILGEGSQVTMAAENLKDKIAPVSAVVGLVTFNSSSAGEQISYIGETLSDWFSEGKILGIKVAGNSDGMSVIANAITTAGMTPQQIAQELQKAGFVAPPATPAPVSESPTATPSTPSPVTPIPSTEPAASTTPPSAAPPSGEKTLTDEELSGTYSVTVDNGTGKRTYEAEVRFAAGTATVDVKGEDTLTFAVSGDTITTHLGAPINADMAITFSKEGETIVGRGSMVMSVSGGKRVEMKYLYTKIG
ncbi:MAG: hypothetical protein AAGU74_14885 [Bacillota bacterium]